MIGPEGSPPLLAGRRVLVTGAGGQLGSALRLALAGAGAVVVGLGARPATGVDVVADITDAAGVRRAVDAAAPAAVIHAAAWTDVDGAERDPERANLVNGEGSRHVAAAARAIGARVMAVGSDYVFSGGGGAPYGEDAVPDPISAYGRSKLFGERAVLAVDPSFTVARTAWLWGGSGKHFPRTVLTVLRDRGGMEVVTDEAGSPTHVTDLATALVGLLAAGGSGIYHLAGEGRATRWELARAVAEAAGLDPEAIRPTTTAAFLAKYPLPASRPADSELTNQRGEALNIRLPSWRESVATYTPALAAELGLQRVAEALL